MFLLWDYRAIISMAQATQQLHIDHEHENVIKKGKIEEEKGGFLLNMLYTFRTHTPFFLLKV